MNIISLPASGNIYWKLYGWHKSMIYHSFNNSCVYRVQHERVGLFLFNNAFLLSPTASVRLCAQRGWCVVRAAWKNGQRICLFLRIIMLNVAFNELKSCKVNFFNVEQYLSLLNGDKSCFLACVLIKSTTYVRASTRLFHSGVALVK